MNTEYLKTFLQVAEYKNIRKASQQLYLTQSTVSSRLQTLEEEVGHILFERSNKTLILTPAGEDLIPYAKSILEMEERMMDRMHERNQNQEKLRIGISDTIYHAYVEERIPSFITNHPEIALRFSNKSSSIMLNQLQDDGLDIVISFLGNSSANIYSRVLRKEEVILITGMENSPYRLGISREELLRQPIFYSDFYKIDKDQMAWHDAVFPSNFNYSIHLDVIWDVIKLVQNANGYAFLPRRFVEKQLREGSLFEIPMNFRKPPLMSMFLCVKKSRLSEAKIAAFLTMLEDLMENDG